MTSLTAVDPVRAHVLTLRSSGASWQSIAGAAGVGAMTVFDVTHRNTKVSQATAAALLAVTSNDLDRPRVDANGAMLRLRSLQAIGHSSARVARAIGCHEQSIQRVVNGAAKTISADLYQGVAAVFSAWWNKTPPERTRVNGRRRALPGTGRCTATGARARRSTSSCWTSLATGRGPATGQHPAQALQRSCI